jgi:hypothetical protein
MAAVSVKTAATQNCGHPQGILLTSLVEQALFQSENTRPHFFQQGFETSMS